MVNMNQNPSYERDTIHVGKPTYLKIVTEDNSEITFAVVISPIKIDIVEDEAAWLPIEPKGITCKFEAELLRQDDGTWAHYKLMENDNESDNA